MTEYHGQLIGGPDNGNVITSTVEKVPATGTKELWPDGPEGESRIFINKGMYVWNGEHFYWLPDTFYMDPRS